MANRCSLCNSSSNDIPLLLGMSQEKPFSICRSCMPLFVHGLPLEELRQKVAAAPPASGPGPAELNLDKQEKKLIEAALQHTKGNKARACRELGISKPTLLRKLRSYGLMPERHLAA